MQSRIIPDIVKDQTICSLPQNSSVHEAARQMGECDVAAVVVTGDDGRMIGIVTERDITRRVVGRGLDPKTTPLMEVMTRDPETLSPDDLASEALEVMQRRGFRHIPVVDDDESVIGMVSIRDLYAAVHRALEDDLHETEAFVFGERYGTA